MAIENVNDSIEKPWLPVRYLQAIMLFLGMMLTYSTRVTMSIAIIAMTALSDNNTEELNWDLLPKTLVLSSFMAGVVVTQIPGHFLAFKFGGKLLICSGIAISSVISAAVPLGAYDAGYIYVCGCRLIQGLAHGAIIPSINMLIRSWSPAEEKNTWDCLVLSGSQLGTAAEFLISAAVINKFGWQAVFYLNFLTGAIFTAVFIGAGANSPHESKLISDYEKEYIEKSRKQDQDDGQSSPSKLGVWWSLPFVSLVVANTAQNWGMWMFMTMIPLYLHDIHLANIVEVGLISATPFIGMLLMKFLFGCISNILIQSNCLRVTRVRKIFNTIGFFGPAAILVAMSYYSAASANVTVAAAFLALTLSLNAAHSNGFMLVHKDIAPPLADQLQMTTNNFADVLSIFTPLTAGAMIADESDPTQWHSVFKLSATIYIACNVFYVIFGTSEKQQWTQPKQDITKETAADP